MTQNDKQKEHDTMNKLMIENAKLKKQINQNKKQQLRSKSKKEDETSRKFKPPRFKYGPPLTKHPIKEYIRHIQGCIN